MFGSIHTSRLHNKIGTLYLIKTFQPMAKKALLKDLLCAIDIDNLEEVTMNLVELSKNRQTVRHERQKNNDIKRKTSRIRF